MRDATAPPPVRDQVRLLVVTGDGVADAQFRDLPAFLCPGDLVVVNTSATLAAAVDGRRPSGEDVVVHLSSQLDDGSWVVEIRPPGTAHGPVDDVRAGERLNLQGTQITVLSTLPGQVRLHRVTADGDVRELMWDHGRPIRYSYVPEPWPLSAYQTVFAREAGSAEMPSAGRPFTHDLVTDLVTCGVLVAPVTLHTGVSSAEDGEPPQPERFRVPSHTARLVNHVRREGGRIVAVGTTVTRALESALGADDQVEEREGWTDLVLGPDRPAQVVNGLVTGWHTPGASHLQLLEAVAGLSLVRAAYEVAERLDYLWHEFGDSCLLLP